MIMGVLFGTMANVCTRLVDDPGFVATNLGVLSSAVPSLKASPSLPLTSAFTCTSICIATSFASSATFGLICNNIPGDTASNVKPVWAAAKEFAGVVVLRGNCFCSVTSITAARLFKAITLGRESTSA